MRRFHGRICAKTKSHDGTLLHEIRYGFVRSYQGNSWALSKVSNSGTILEYTRYFDADNPPSKIVQDGDYFKYIRNKAE